MAIQASTGPDPEQMPAEALESPHMLHLAHSLPLCRTLGPGARGVLWVAGCSRRCPGCIASPLHAPNTGEVIFTDELADRILEWPLIEGLTISGGEPFEQASALADLCERLRASRDLSIMAYSGFTLETLRESTDPSHACLLSCLDILVDGPFLIERQADLLWRGSSNQRVHFLSSRHASLVVEPDKPGVGLELHVSLEGKVFWAGIPAPGFHEALSALPEAYGIHLSEVEGVWA